MSSVKEYAMSEHRGWFIQPTITQDSDGLERGEKLYQCDILISDSKRTFTVQQTRLFKNSTQAADSAYTNGRKLVDKHFEKYKSCVFYTTSWWLGGKGVFKERVLEHSD